MIDKIKKHDNILFAFIVFIASLGWILLGEICVSDEIWNFNNAFKVYSGYQMYSEINMIIPPIYFIFINCFFHILKPNILTFKLVALMSHVVTSLLMYNVLKELKVSKRASVAYLAIMQSIFFGMSLLGANYNLLAMTFTIFGLMLLLKDKYKNNWILQSIISYLILFTKQNIGVYYILSIIIIEIILNGINKSSIKKLFKYGCLIALFVILSLGVFAINGNLTDFISLTVLGIGEFTQNFSFDSYVGTLILIDIIVVAISILFNKKNILKDGQKEKMVVLTVFSVVYSLIIYPIINEFHILISLMIPAITFVYLFHSTLIKELELDNVICKIGLGVWLLFGIVSSYNVCQYFKNADFSLNSTHPYYGVIMAEEEKGKMGEMTEYIQNITKNGEEIVIISQDAGMYLIPFKINNYIFDLPFIGNLGKDGEEGLIQKIDSLENTKILIKKEEIFWQESQRANDYIKENFEKLGEICDFEIYNSKQ